MAKKNKSNSKKKLKKKTKKKLKKNSKNKSKNTFYVTTPIYYTNAAPHLGGAYTTMLADILARWNRNKGKDVFFLTGTDEHGKKVQEIAEKKGLAPKKFVDEIVKEWKKCFKMLNISHDYFIRTTNPKHEKQVKKMLQKLYDKKLIYKGSYESYYCVGCEQYLTEKDLVDGKCPLHNKKPELKKEEAYMFKLSKFQDQLLKIIKSGEYNIVPEKRRKEIIGFIESGLQDISISRLKENVYWGIPLPFDKDHCTWVWPDAFWNYVSGLKINNKFDKFWPADVQLMAKDILRVHATIWPALLLASDLPLPKNLGIHGFFTVDKRKMSKSLGNVLDPIELTEKYGADAVRYYMARNIPFGDDGDVSEQGLVDRYNNELANKLGNLISRVAGLIEKKGTKKTSNNLIKKLKLKKIEKLMQDYDTDKALSEIFSFIDVCNEYIQDKKPWGAKKDEGKKILFELKESILKIAELLQAFIPESAEKITKQFSAKKIKKGKILFEKMDFESADDKEKTKDIKTKKSFKMQGIVNMADTVSFNDWGKLDLRVAQIKDVEDIEGADKLYKLRVDVGPEIGERTLCAGLKKYYSKKQLKDKKIVMIVNLEPKKLRGVKSQGMLLAASNDSHSKVILLNPGKESEPGMKIS
ncbi:methionine--tRNA ligase [Candidatus Pacearchaeota archaeon]|nr:methionine--tRNA ligase [Candidatus Pacearchaeota archaeon]